MHIYTLFHVEKVNCKCQMISKLSKSCNVIFVSFYILYHETMYLSHICKKKLQHCIKNAQIHSFFLVYIFPYLNWANLHAQSKYRKYGLLRKYLDTFHAVLPLGKLYLELNSEAMSIDLALVFISQPAVTYSKLTIKISERCHYTPCSSVSIVNFEQVNAGWDYWLI